MVKFVLGIAVGVLLLSYYPKYIGDVKKVANSAAQGVVDATDSSMMDKAKELIQ